MKIFIFIIIFFQIIDFTVRLLVDLGVQENYIMKIEKGKNNVIGMIINLTLIIWGGILLLR